MIMVHGWHDAMIPSPVRVVRSTYPATGKVTRGLVRLRVAGVTTIVLLFQWLMIGLSPVAQAGAPQRSDQP